MKKKLIAASMFVLISLFPAGCSKIEVMKTIIQANSGSNTETSKKSTKKTPSGNTLADGTLKNSRLTEQEKPFAGFWESEDGHLLAIREAALASDGYTIDFPLDAILFFPYVKKAENYGTIWDVVRRRDENITLTEEDGKLIFRDSQYCPNSNDPGDSSTHRSTEQLVYDSSTDTITYRMLYDEAAVYWEGSNGQINQVIFHRSDKDIEEADWDWYYDSQEWRDPR